MTPSRRRLSAALSVGALLLMIGLTALPVGAATLPAPSALPIGFNSGRAIDQRVSDGLGWARTGAWELSRSRLLPDGRLKLTIRMNPPDTGFAGRSGPAVLFARLELEGGVGGSGVGAEAAPVSWDAIPACSDESRCEYVGRITLQTRGLYQLAAAQAYLESPIAIVGLTLVRSFGQGRWLQMMPMFGEVPDDGTLAEPGRVEGDILSMGMMPAARATPSDYPNQKVVDWVSIIEGARDRLGDPSDPIPTVSAQLDVSLNECGGYWMVAIHDADGNLPLAVFVDQRSAIHKRITIPDNREWTLTSQGEEGIFEFTEGPDGAGLHVGTFATNGHDLSITADLTCGLGPSGSLAVAPATLPETDTSLEGRIPDADAGPTQLILVAAAVAGLWAARRRRLGQPI